ncbi:hypothetical protein SAMN05216559_2309 [Halomicrobium zhouii]|uniref:Uncharacterized protein n=1 Tax=Halomicrobium zhouii TaxID=767519 RepID=A0A1I6LA46_9EURY|nr:hypothetical protein SAMN05216559_2309 [Halomicrobium zhouii]
MERCQFQPRLLLGGFEFDTITRQQRIVTIVKRRLPKRFKIESRAAQERFERTLTILVICSHLNSPYYSHVDSRRT